jgi:hypothetical protein
VVVFGKQLWGKSMMILMMMEYVHLAIVSNAYHHHYVEMDVYWMVDRVVLSDYRIMVEIGHVVQGV